MKKHILLNVLLAALSLQATTYTYTDKLPFAPSTGTAEPSKLDKDDVSIIGWADGFTGIQYGEQVDAKWKTPHLALGKAAGTPFDIVCLGRGGQITMTFSRAIQNGNGPDFSVFENAISDSSLELAWVEVSTDGEHFVRFPNYSAIPDVVGTYGNVDQTLLYGLASKYSAGNGTPFDLSELILANQAIADGNTDFSATFTEQFTNNFQHLDLNNIHYIRLTDIVGDGTAEDAGGFAIYDQYPTYGSGGFDLDAIGIIHQVAVTGTPQTITFTPIPSQRLDTGRITLSASSDSGLPVNLTVIDGQALLNDNQLSFTNSGTIQIQATQSGDPTYAPATPVIRSFTVAEKLQHIYLDPIPNQIAGSSAWNLTATADSGLPVAFEVIDGPSSAYVIYNTTQLNIGNTTGIAILRAYQAGNATYAAATDVYQQYEIVSVGNTNAPLIFSLWCASNAIPNNTTLDSDHDGASNLREYGMGTDPKDPLDRPEIILTPTINIYSEPVMQLKIHLSKTAITQPQFLQTPSLKTAWSNTIPKLVNTVAGETHIQQTLQLPMTNSTGFIKISIGEIE